MKRTKTLIKTAIIALVFMLSIAVSFAITGAWYLATRNANGTITLNDGIIIDYSGFDQGAGVWENNAEFSLFGNGSAMLPGASVNLNNAAIKANSTSADFFARVKLEYKFFTDLAGEYEVTNQISDYSAFINTPTFAQGWVDGRNGDGWFYYATGSTFNTLPSVDYVNIFTPNQSITLNGDAAGFDHQGGGYQYDEFTLIKRIEVVLTLSTYQADLAAAANAGWGIAPPVIQNASGQVVEICSNQITLGNMGGEADPYKLGTGEAGSLNTGSLTTLKIVVAGNSQINANAFAGNKDLEEVYIGDQEYIDGTPSNYSAKIYTNTPTFTIGTNAFNGCSSLDIYLSSSVNYNIYASSLVGANNVYYDGVLTNGLKSPSVGAVSGTTITVLANPSIVTGGTGAGAVNQVSNSKGEYTYEDAAGNIWYFDLGSLTPGDYGYIWEKDNINGTEAQIRYCQTPWQGESNQTITIPDFVNASELSGIPVVDICVYTNDVNTSVIYAVYRYSSIIIPNTIKRLSTGAIGRAENLTSLIIPTSVTCIENAIVGCDALTSFELPNTITHFSGVFSCGIQTITIPESVVYWRNSNPFASCNNLTSFSSHNSKFIVSSDGKCLIEVNESNYKLISLAIKGLTAYEIPNVVTSIGDRVCCWSPPNSYTPALWPSYTIVIPSSVIEINPTAFMYQYHLSTIIINSFIESIPYGCFSNCTNLTSVTLPVSVTSIDSSAFSGCSKLQSINWSASYDLGAEKNNEVVTLAKATTGLTLGDINLPDATDLAAASITAPIGQVFAGWTDGETTYTTTAPIAKVRAGLTAVWENE